MKDILAHTLSYYAGHPVLQLMVLFLGPFVLEEAALVAGAGLAAAGELPPELALGALYAGTIASDWVLYGVGVLAARSTRIRRFIGEKNIAFGRRFLARSTFYAALSARLVPWLLPPIFLASGYLQVGFVRFATINSIVALVYVNVVFWVLWKFEALLFATISRWAWLVILVLMLVLFGTLRLIAHRRKPG